MPSNWRPPQTGDVYLIALLTRRLLSLLSTSPGVANTLPK